VGRWRDDDESLRTVRWGDIDQKGASDQNRPNQVSPPSAGCFYSQYFFTVKALKHLLRKDFDIKLAKITFWGLLRIMTIKWQFFASPIS
jgi:hypothetical protein